MTLQLQTIICSTRPGRTGPSIAQWFLQVAEDQGQFEAHLIDLADFGLPVYDDALGPDGIPIDTGKFDKDEPWAEPVGEEEQMLEWLERSLADSDAGWSTAGSSSPLIPNTTSSSVTAESTSKKYLALSPMVSPGPS